MSKTFTVLFLNKNANFFFFIRAVICRLKERQLSSVKPMYLCDETNSISKTCFAGGFKSLFLDLVKIIH